MTTKTINPIIIPGEIGKDEPIVEIGDVVICGVGLGGRAGGAGGGTIAGLI
jgi:hypothetical protein